MKRHILIVAASAIALTACSKSVTNNAGQQQAQSAQAGIDLSWMDKSVKPGDDFFSYADGSWVKNTPIPADRSRIGGFWIADLQREKNTRELFDQIVKSNPTTGNDALLYKTSMPPCADAAGFTQLSVASYDDRSTGAVAVMTPPASTTSRTVSSDVCGLRSHSTTVAPSAAKRSAAARPMPTPVPVIRATLPASRDIVRLYPQSSGDVGLTQQRGNLFAELFVGLLEAGVVSFAERDEKIACADHLTLFD